MKRKLNRKDLEMIKGYALFCCRRADIILSFWCPFCRYIHSHGIGSDLREVGPQPFMPTHRAQHCHTEGGRLAFPNGYYIFYEK